MSVVCVCVCVCGVCACSFVFSFKLQYTWHSIREHAQDVSVGERCQRKGSRAPALWYGEDGAINGIACMREGHLAYHGTALVPLQCVIEVGKV